MKHLILGTAGHIDHGKTSLVKALTGIDTDRLKEEKARGITIELGFAHLELPGIQFGIVDVPGHERFVRAMVAGAGAREVAAQTTVTFQPDAPLKAAVSYRLRVDGATTREVNFTAEATVRRLIKKQTPAATSQGRNTSAETGPQSPSSARASPGRGWTRSGPRANCRRAGG